MKTLREIPKVKQADTDLTRRWFSCGTMDLYVWQSKSGETRAFEICYDKAHDEHAFRWSREAGVTHHRIDDGETTPFEAKTPIAVPDGAFNPNEIALKFEAVGASLEPALYRLVLRMLLNPA